MSLYRSQSSVMYSRYPYYSTDVLPGSTVSVLHRNDESTAEIEHENINKDYSADIELCQDLR